MKQDALLGQLLPLLVVGLVLVLRWRRMSRARVLRHGSLWVAPAIYMALVSAMMLAMPPRGAGWLVLAAGLGLGAALGWQRARLSHLHIDAETGKLMMRQSPAALFMLIGIMMVRRVAVAAFGGAGSGAGMDGHGAAVPQAALLLTDAMLGLALGMLVVMNLLLWSRARALVAGGG